MSFNQIFEKEFSKGYSEDNLKKLFDGSIDLIDDYPQIKYLNSYLSDLECSFMIIEGEYIDKYYLDDYLHFYANCYQDYHKKCKRVHFFKKKFNLDILLKSDSEKFNSNNKYLQEIYLGFLIIRPVHNMYVGRTLLKTYPDTNSYEGKGNSCTTRNIFAIHKYHSNLCGYDLTIESIPFQEQDSVIHMCATTAIWIVLQQSTYKFGYYAPTPYEIKKSAPNYSFHRSIPSSGLTILEIISAIRKFGMEVEISDYGENPPKYYTFSSFIYAFLRGGIPILLSVNIYDSNMTSIGGHALAVLGYQLQENQPPKAKNFLTGNKIKKLYIHDDNFGPFTKYYISEDSNGTVILKCDDRKSNHGNFDIIISDAVIAPVYHKIRFPYVEIITRLTEFLGKLIRSDVFSTIGNDPDNFRDILEWDIYVTSVNKLKKGYRENQYFDLLTDYQKKTIFSGHFPRFIWRCQLLYEGLPLFEILGDATEAKTQFPFFCSFCYLISLNNLLKKFYKLFEYRKWEKIMIDLNNIP
ncbi:MAG: hypothetical protein ACTSVU_02440 [Promethearchaeota archaeon]